MATVTIGWSSGVTIYVAAGTSYSCMSSGQRECCSCIVIKRCGRPYRWRMTGYAVSWNLCWNVIWICCCVVFIQVTAYACCWYSCISCSMAADTTYSDVTSWECKSCCCIVIKRRRCPGCWSVTGLAVGWELGWCMVWISRSSIICSCLLYTSPSPRD